MTMQEALHALEDVKQAINLAYVSGYSAGKQQREWQGLTKGQRDDFSDKYGSYEAVCAIEQVLKEKNDH